MNRQPRCHGLLAWGAMLVVLWGTWACAQETGSATDERRDDRVVLELASERLRLSGFITDVAVSPDGKKLVAIAPNQSVPTAWLVDEPTGRLIETIELPPPAEGSISCITFSPDGRHLLWGEEGGQVTLWNLAERGVVYRAPLHRDKVHDVEFSATGKLFATASADGVVHVRELSDPDAEYRRLIPGETRNPQADVVAGVGGVATIAFTPDEEMLVVGMGGSGKIVTWRLADDVSHIAAPFESKGSLNPLLRNLGITPDGKSLMAAGQRTVPRSEIPHPFGLNEAMMAEILFWSLETGDHQRTLRGNDWYSFGNATLSPDGKRVALAEFSRLQIVDAEKGERVKSFELPGEWGSLPRFSPDGRRVYMPLGNSIGVFDVDAPEGAPPRDQDPVGIVHAIAWSPDAKQIATAHHDGQLRVWEADGGKLRWRQQLAPVVSRSGWRGRPSLLAFTRDGTGLVAAGSRDDPVDFREGIVVVFDAATGERRREIVVDSEVRRAALAPDGKQIVVATSNGGFGETVLRMIDLESEEEVFTFPEGAPAGEGLWSVEALGFTPAGTILVAAGNAETLVLNSSTGAVEQRFMADTRTPPQAGEPPHQLLQIFQAAFSADGSTYVATSRENLAVWDVASGILRQTLRHPENHRCLLAPSPDGKLVAGADVNSPGDPSDDTIRLFDSESGEVVTTFERPGRRACKLAFSPDGRQLMAGFHDGSVVVWNLDAE